MLQEYSQYIVRWFTDTFAFWERQTLANQLQAISDLGVLIAIATIILQWLISNRQKRRSFLSEKQANHARLIETYMRWHAEVLNNDNNLEFVNSVLLRSQRIAGRDDRNITRQVHMMYMILNVLFLDWQHCRIYDRRGMRSFERTVSNTMAGIAENSAEEYRYLFVDFENIFSDYPAKFLADIRKVMGGKKAKSKTAVRISRWCSILSRLSRDQKKM